MQATHLPHAHALASALWDAQVSGVTCDPVRQGAAASGWDASELNAYQVQRELTTRRRAAGDSTIGRKVGLTTPLVRKQIGVNQPDSGYLWSSTAYGDGDSVKLSDFIQPKLEVEVALILGHAIDNPDATMADVIRATAFVVPAFEIVDCRIHAWDVKLFDLISDNAAAAGLVLGAEPRLLHELTLRSARMTLRRGAEVVAEGIGSDCMGHPLNAAVWLARQSARDGEPLRAGEIILTGALGPMLPISGPGRYEGSIEGVGSVAVEFT